MSLTPLERRQLRETQEFLASCTHRWYVDEPRLGLTVGTRLEPDHIRVCLHLTRLGEEYPGGWDVLRNASLHFTSEQGGVAEEVSLCAGSPEARISGAKAFTRLRGTIMFPWGLMQRLALPKGIYQLRLTGELIRGEPLSLLCDSFDYFADSLVQALEAHDEFHRTKAPYGYGSRTPLVAPVDLLVGTFENDRDRLSPPPVYWTNELAVIPVDWERARSPLPPFSPPPSANDPMAPQNYFRDALFSGLHTFAERGACRFGTHVNPGPVTEQGECLA